MTSRYVRDGALDLTFDFSLASSTITALNSRDAGLLNTALREIAEAYPADTLATFLANHDQNRIADRLAGDDAALRLAAALLLTGPGTPFLYYGEEIGMSGAKPDERIRTPMRWDPTAPGFGFSTGTPWEAPSNDAAGTDVATQSVDPGSLLSAYRSLIRLRASHPALLGGELVPIQPEDRQVVAFLRSDGDAHALVVANLGVTAVQAPALGLDAGPLCGTPVATALLGPAERLGARRLADGRVRGLRAGRGARAPGGPRHRPRDPVSRAGAPVAGRPRAADPLPPRPGAVELAAAILSSRACIGIVTAVGGGSRDRPSRSSCSASRSTRAPSSSASRRGPAACGSSP